ncbi:DhNV_024 [Dikerogammarus haemobaphes nudivirus]|nr:DhNV_024 [Dikerogammarus haemobaphes nudivirus]
MDDTGSVLSLEEDRPSIPEEYHKLVKNVQNSKMTHEQLKMLKDIRSKLDKTEYRNVIDFRTELEKKINVGASKLGNVSAKDVYAKHVALTNDYTRVCCYCTNNSVLKVPKKTFVRYSGLVNHIKTRHHYMHDATLTPEQESLEFKMKVKLRTAKLEDATLDCTVWKSEFEQKVVVEIPAPSTSTFTVPMPPTATFAVPRPPTPTATFAVPRPPTSTFVVPSTSNATFTIPTSSIPLPSMQETFNVPPQQQNTLPDMSWTDLENIIDENMDSENFNMIDLNTVAQHCDMALSVVNESETMAAVASIIPENSSPPTPKSNNIQFVIEGGNSPFNYDIESEDEQYQPTLYRPLPNRKQYPVSFKTNTALIDPKKLDQPSTSKMTTTMQEIETAKTSSNCKELERIKMLVENKKRKNEEDIITPPPKKNRKTPQLRIKTPEFVEDDDTTVEEDEITSPKINYIPHSILDPSSPPSMKFGGKGRKMIGNKKGKKKNPPLGGKRRTTKRTPREDFLNKDVVTRKGGKKNRAHLASQAEILNNAPHTLTMIDIISNEVQEQIDNDPEVDISELFNESINRAQTNKNVKKHLASFLKAKKLTNTNSVSDDSPKKINHLRCKPNVTRNIGEYADASVNVDYYSKASNVLDTTNDLLTWIDAYNKYHNLNVPAEERKRLKAEALSQTDLTKHWKAALKKLTPKTLNLLEKPAFDEVPILRKIKYALTNYIEKRAHQDVDLKPIITKLSKYTFCKSLDDETKQISFTIDDVLSYKNWVRSDTILRKNINLTSKVRTFMSRMCSVLQDPNNPMNQFTRLSRTKLETTFNSLITLYTNQNDLESQVQHREPIQFTDGFYNNLMIMLMRFIYNKYKSILFISKVTKRNGGANIVDAGILDILTRDTTMDSLSEFFDAVFEQYFTSDRFSKTLTQMQILYMKTFNPRTMDDVRKAVEERNVELLDMYNTRCSDIVYTIIRSNSFQMLCDVAKNIVYKYINVENKTDLTWPAYTRILFDVNYYQFSGEVVTAMKFPPIVDSESDLIDYWSRASDEKKASLFTQFFLSTNVEDDDDLIMQGVETQYSDEDV